MNKSYESWSKFDVDAALKASDEMHAREDRLEERTKQYINKKLVLEKDVTHEACMDAQILASHAAVAELKAKRRKGRNRTNANLQEEEKQVPVDEAQLLQDKAKVMQRKSELVKQIVKMKENGFHCLKAREFEQAIECLEKGLERAQDLLGVIPELNRLHLQEEERSNQEDERAEHVHEHDEDQHTHEHVHGEHHSCHGHEHGEHDSTCSHEIKEKKKLYGPELPPTSDIEGVARMFQQDCWIGIGACHAGLNQFGESSEAYKKVLLQERFQQDAWLGRGQAFLSMRVPSLAYLHFNQILMMNETHDEGKDALEKAKQLVASMAEKAEEDLLADEIQCLRSESFKKSILAIAKMIKEGEIIMLEGFFHSATRKFTAILSWMNDFCFGEANKGIEGSTVLRHIAYACHMNIAGCQLEMGTNFASSVEHCTRALSLSEEDAGKCVAYFRRGVAQQMSKKYMEALNDLQKALSLCHDGAKHDVISTQIDKCTYDRSQFDGSYIRSQMANPY